MRQALVVLIAVAIAGCASAGNSITVDRTELALALGDAHAHYAVIAAQLAQACASKTLDEATCATLAAGQKEAALIYKQIRKALGAPAKSGLDMEQVGEYLGVILKMAGKAAL